MLFVFLVSLAGVNNAALASPALPDAPVVSATTGGISLSWQVPPVEITQAADGQVAVKVAGVENETAPGVPELPVLSLLVAIPPQASPSIQMGKISMQTRALTGQMRLAPKAQPVKRADGTEIEVDETSLAPSSPQMLATFEEVGIMRGVRLGRLVLRPVLLEGSQFTVYTHVQLNLNFNALVVPSSIQDDVLIDQVRAAVVNPSQVQSTLDNQPAGNVIPLPAPPSSAPVMIMEISQSGIYTVSYEQLNSAGFGPASVDPRNIHILHGTVEVAYEWVNASGATITQDGTFAAGETLRFYARPTISRWATFDTFTLSVLDTPGTLMTSRSAAPGSGTTGVVYYEKAFEQNIIYTPDAYFTPPMDATRNNDPWVWDEMRAGESRSYSFNLGSVGSAQDGVLTLHMNGFTVSGHNVEVTLNGSYLGTITWTGKTYQKGMISIPAGRLMASGNTLGIRITSSSYDGVWVDAFSVRYPQGSDAVAGDAPFLGGNCTGTCKFTVNITSPTTALAYNVVDAHLPVRLTGFTTGTNTLTLQDAVSSSWPGYFVTTAPKTFTPNTTLRKKTALLTAATTGAQYVVIAHPNFLAGVDTLVNHRTSKGLSVVKENVKAIYDNFANGIPTPQAIQDYLKAAYASWSPKPQYVVLVGDATWDVKDYLTDSGNSNVSYIPSFLMQVDNFTNEEAADNRFATVEGTDNLADLMIGRLPVNSTAELSTMITKIVNYENNPPTGDWRKKGTVVADHPLAGDYPFYQAANNLYTTMGTLILLRQKIYYQVNYPTGADTRNAIIQAWNAGTALITFNGHSSFHQWGGKSPNELFFHIDNVPSLTNGYKLPALLELTCFSSQFHMPGFTALDEAIVRSAAGGAIITFGSTGPGYSGSHVILGNGFIGALRTGNATAGQAMAAGKLKLITEDPNHKYLADTFTLLGDPAVTIAVDVLNIKQMFIPAVSK